MICPRCGTQLLEDAKFCPACHHSIHRATSEDDDRRRWCESCGSPIPAGFDVCPECGMPVEGAFDEEEGEVFSVNQVVSQPETDDTGFVSAIPPEPKRGSEAPHERPRNTRILLIAALAALVVVGGTILYIFRPWDPEAYTTHAMVDADTSMEGFPGERPWLSSQDKIEENGKQAVIDEELAYLDETYARLAELSTELDAAHEDIVAYMDRGYVLEDDAASKVAQVQKELRERKSTITGDSILEEPQDVQRRDSVLVLVDYLSGAADVLGGAWSTAVQGNGSSETVFKVRSLLAGESSEHGYDAWHELFENAYKSESA